MITEFIQAYALESLIFISFSVTLIMTFVTKYFTNQNKMKELKEIQKACRIELKGKEAGSKEWKEINSKMLQCSLEMMKHSTKPMLFTFLPLILLITWIRDIYALTDIAGTWLWWYIGTSIVSSIILRKVFDVV